jgi:hypothetical protein
VAVVHLVVVELVVTDPQFPVNLPVVELALKALSFQLLQQITQ